VTVFIPLKGMPELYLMEGHTSSSSLLPSKLVMKFFDAILSEIVTV
jgi:hypothetical protein